MRFHEPKTPEECNKCFQTNIFHDDRCPNCGKHRSTPVRRHKRRKKLG